MKLPIPAQTSEPSEQIASLPGGDKLAYLDSGPVPDSNDFTTLVLLHGMHFNAYGFEHLLPLAQKYNLRLIILQKKDYSGSSRYTDAELTTLVENPRVFFQNIGLMLSQFVYYLIQTTPVCLPSENHSKGGIGIGGWSLGATHAMAMFAQRDVLDDPVYSAILPYVTGLVFYDPPYCDFGIPPLVETLLTSTEFNDEVKDAFQLGVSSYYDQPAKWDGLPSTLDLRSHTDHCTFTSWTRAQQDRWTEDFPLRSDSLILTNTRIRSYLVQLTTEVLFNFDVNSCPFPLAPVAYIFARQSTWHSQLARYEIGNKRADLLKQGLGANLRPICFKDVEWANHFIHYDYPEEFLRMLGECILRQDH